MNLLVKLAGGAIVTALALSDGMAQAQVSPETVTSLGAPDKIETGSVQTD